MNATQSKPSYRASLRGLLNQDHQRLERLFVDLLAAFNADAREDTQRLWDEFDSGLGTHLAFEERLLLPVFGAANPTEARALLAEHDQIRSTLSELGVGLDLHLTRADVVSDFIAKLRSHARREDELMYRWAEQHTPQLAQVLLEQMEQASNGGGGTQTGPSNAPGS
jgi:hemerythrin